MGGFVIKLIAFFFLFILSNIVYLIFIQNIDWNYSKRLEALNFNSPNYDVLVLGNSLAMDGIDAEELSKNGFNAYNLALGGSSLMTNYIQLGEYFSMYNHKPRYVILGLGSYMGPFKGDNIHPIVDFTSSNKVYSINDIPIIKFKWLFKEQLKKVISKQHREAYLINGQLRFRKAVEDNTSIDEGKEFPLEQYSLSEILSSIINLCIKNEVKLIIVEMPGFKKVRHKKSFNCLLLDEKNNNGFLLDFNNIEFGFTFDDKKDWIGNSHLNEIGARKLTKYIIEDMKLISTDAKRCINVMRAE